MADFPYPEVVTAQAAVLENAAESGSPFCET